MSTPPLVLVPGLASSSRVWDRVLPALWRQGPVTIANHIRDDSIPAIAARLLANAPDRFALAGHSMGGYIAFEVLRQAPQRVERLALICTQARPDTPEGSDNRRRQMAQAQSGNYAAAMEQFYPLLVHEARRDDPAMRAAVAATNVDITPEDFVRQQTAIIARADSRPTLATIACPTLVLTGDGDKLLPMPLSVEMANGIAGAKLVVLDNCGHMPQIEQPTGTADALVDWLTA